MIYIPIILFLSVKYLDFPAGNIEYVRTGSGVNVASSTVASGALAGVRVVGT